MARRIRWQLLIAGVSSLLIILMMGALALSQTAVARPSAGGSYVEGSVGVPEQINPLLNDSNSDPVGADIGSLLFEGLTKHGFGGLPEPALAERWQISDDGTVYTFTLRSGLTWHDGAPLDADDVVFTLRALKRPDFAGPPTVASLWRDVLVDKVDDLRVRCTLSAPFSPFLSVTTVPILPEHILRSVPLTDWPTADFNRTPVGNGPYRLVSLDGQHAVLEANTLYHDRPPLLERVEFRFFASSNDALQALERGQVNGTGFVATRQLDAPALPQGVNNYLLPLDDYTVLTFNLRHTPLNSLELRRALARGLDKQILIDQALDGRALAVDTPILPGLLAASPDAGWYAPDPQRAAQTLIELGYELGSDGILTRDGTPLKLSLISDSAPDRVAVAQEIARQWRQIGVAVEVTEFEADRLEQQLQGRNFDLALHGWAQLGADPDVLELWHSSQAERGSNYAGLEDERIDELLTEGRQISDQGRRTQIYGAFQRRWVELAPSIILYSSAYAYVFQPHVGIPSFQAPGPRPPVLIGRQDRFRMITRWYVNSSQEIQGELRTPR